VVTSEDEEDVVDEEDKNNKEREQNITKNWTGVTSSSKSDTERIVLTAHMMRRMTM
jgi:hypothetical protein